MFVIVYRIPQNVYRVPEIYAVKKRGQMSVKKFRSLFVMIIGLVLFAFAALAETQATKVVGEKDIRIKQGEGLAIPAAQFSLYPVGSTFNGKTLYELDYSLYGYNYIFRDRSLGKITGGFGKALVPGVYPMYARFKDPDTGEILTSGYFNLTVEDEQGNVPALDDLTVLVYPIGPIEKGVPVQVNWGAWGTYYEPISYTLSVSKGGTLIESWAYDDDERDTFTPDEYGEYTVTVEAKDSIGKTASSSVSFEAADQGTLQLNSLTVGPDALDPVPKYYRLYWSLDYSGGHGRLTCDVELQDAETGEYVENLLAGYGKGFFPSFSGSVSLDGSYYLEMKVTDDDGTQTIRSDAFTIAEPDENGLVAKNGGWYCYENGSTVSGWKKIDGNVYYFNPIAYTKGTYRLVRNGVTGLFTFDQNGILTTGWSSQDGNWYYIDEDGVMLRNNWAAIDGNWYWFDPDCAMALGWKQIDGVWYYFSDSGAMVNGWQQISGVWYYFNDSGAIVAGWQQINDSWYYFNDSGAMVNGWQRIGGSWYYFDDSGAMVTGWFRDMEAEARLSADQKRELWYWFDTSGAMVTGRKEIDGKWEMFSDSGEWLYTGQAN